MIGLEAIYRGLSGELCTQGPGVMRGRPVRPLHDSFDAMFDCLSSVWSPGRPMAVNPMPPWRPRIRRPHLVWRRRLKAHPAKLRGIVMGGAVYPGLHARTVFRSLAASVSNPLPLSYPAFFSSSPKHRSKIHQRGGCAWFMLQTTEPVWSRPKPPSLSRNAHQSCQPLLPLQT